MEATGEGGQIFLLIPDYEELLEVWKQPPNPSGYDKIIIHEDVVADFRTHTWYWSMINIKVPKLWIVRKLDPDQRNPFKDLKQLE